MAKKFNFKQFLINHGEKVGVGIAGLLGLWGLAGTTWTAPDLAEVPVPSLLEINSDKTTAQIEGNTWPDEEKEKFASTPNVVELASAIGRGSGDGLQGDRFAMPVVWNEPLNGIRAKRKQMVVLAPYAPEVSAVTVAIALAPEEEEGEDEEADDEESEEEMSDEEKELDAIRKEFGISQDSDVEGAAGIGQLGALAGGGGLPSGMLQAMGLGGMMGPGGPGGGGGRGPVRGRGADDIQDQIESRFGGLGGIAGMLGGGGIGGLASQLGLDGAAADLLPTNDREVEWRAGVSVRMLVDLRKQRQEITKALHVKGMQQTQQFIDYQQMHVERQELRNGVWSEEWDPVSIDDLGEILEESLGIDVDPVSPAVTRAEITMPLPRRGTGQWLESDVSHTRVYDFTLTSEELNMMNKMNTIIAQRAKEAEARQPKERKERKGFDQYTADMSSMGQSALSGYFGGSMDAMRGDISGIMSGIFGDKDGKLSDRHLSFIDEQLEQIDPEDANAVDRLLLVRFIDFTAERGKTYRYRVRLEMRNPNYGAPVDQLEQPEYATTDTIVSDWSPTTPAVEVPMAYHVYVEEFDEKRRTAKLPTYIESDGALPAMDTLEVHVGMPIGGSRKQERVDLEKQKLDAGEVTYKTSEVLCAASHQDKPDASTHPDLAEQLKKLRRRTQPVGDMVCVVDHTGDLVLRGAGDQPDQERLDNLIVSTIIKEYESWRGGGADDLLAQFGDGGLNAMLGASMGGLGMGQGSIAGALADEERGRGKRKNRKRDR